MNTSAITTAAGLVEPAWLARRCTDNGLRALEPTMAELIRSGELPAGARLPTVRSMALLLGLSPGTVAAVWKNLREDGLIETNRRGGTTVAAARRRPARSGDWVSFDLGHGGPDPRLHPDLEQAMLAGVRQRADDSSFRDTIIPRLVQAVARDWPFTPEEWSTTGGGTEGIHLALDAVADGGPVAVEMPSSPRLVEALHTLGLRVLPVEWDDEGPSVEMLQAALAERPTAFVYQPRAHVPLGRSVTPARMAALARCLTQHPKVSVVEDDGMGPLSSSAALSLGREFPERTLYVRTYCKAFGVDLKVCVVGGGRRLIRRLNKARSFGTGLTSRILQGALAHLLTSPQVGRQIAHARTRYRVRQTLLAEALQRQGLFATPGEGFVLWLPVTDEVTTLVNLSARGIAAGPGSQCHVVSRLGHIALSTARLTESRNLLDELAVLIAGAVRSTGLRGYD